MKKGIIIHTAIILIVALFAACSKDTVVGPTGPIGATGATGPAGNANVQEYDFTIQPNDWILSGNTWSANYIGVTISKADAVLVYIVTGSSTNPNNTSLPFINNVTGIQTYFSNTGTNLTINVNSITNAVIANPGNQTFKIVIIPSSHRMANVNTLNFTEVKNAYHLKGK